MSRYLLIITVFLLLLLARMVHGENPANYSGGITGRVINTQGTPIQGATVVIRELNLGLITQADGTFHMPQLRPGVYHLHASHLGYSPGTIRVEIADAMAYVELVLAQTHIELQEVVVQDHVSGFLKRDHSLSIATANQEYLSQNPGMTLMQSLQRMPGVQAMNIGTGISKPVIRGMSFNRVIVAENNIKQQGQQWGADHGLEIDPYGVERVEVIKGPATLLFGSDAIGGAINIRPAVIPHENTLQAQALFTARSNNSLLGTSMMTALNNNGNFFRARVSLQSYADYKVPAQSFVYNNWIIPLAENRLKNTSGNDLSFAFTGGMRRQWGISSITISNYHQQAGFFPGAHGVPNISQLAQAGNPRQTEFPLQEVNHLKVLSNNNLLLGKHWLEIDLGFQQNHRRELNPPHLHGNGPLPDSNVELELLLSTLSSVIRFHHNPNPSNSWVYGFSGNYQKNTKGGYNFLLPNFNAADGGIFIVTQYSASDQLFLNLGARADIAMVNIEQYQEPVWSDTQTISHYQLRSPGLRKTFFNTTLNSGISWFPAPSWNLKVNLGSSYRTPTPIELSANGIHHGSFRHELGDTSLSGERAYQFDLALAFTRKEVYLSVSPFVNYFSNYLFLNPSGQFSPLPGGGQIYRFQQARALHMGAEAYFDWHLTEQLHTSLGAEVLWAQNLDDHYPLPFIPPHSIIMELSYHWKAIQGVLNEPRLMAGLRRSASQDRVARNEPSTKGYTLVNLGVSTLIRAGSFNMEAGFQVQNVFDTWYQNHLSFYRKLELPEPGRNYIITLKIPFHKTISNSNLKSIDHDPF